MPKFAEEVIVPFPKNTEISRAKRSLSKTLRSPIVVAIAVSTVSAASAFYGSKKGLLSSKIHLHFVDSDGKPIALRFKPSLKK